MATTALKALLSLGTSSLLGLSLALGSPFMDSAAAKDTSCERGPSPEAQSALGYSLYYTLDLSPEQVEELTSILGPFHEQIDGPRDAVESLRAKQDKLYGSMAKDLKKKGKVSASDQEAYNAIHEELRTLKETMGELGKESAKAAAEVLTAAQKETLANYHPAVALGGMESPPKRERPEGDRHRGRDEHHQERMEAKMDLARYATPEQLEKRQAQMVERGTEAGMSEADAQAMANEFMEVIAEMQGLSDEEWATSKADYAEQLRDIAPRHGKRGHSGKKGKHGKEHHPKAKKAGRLLLNPGFYDALQNAS